MIDEREDFFLGFLDLALTTPRHALLSQRDSLYHMAWDRKLDLWRELSHGVIPDATNLFLQLQWDARWLKPAVDPVGCPE